MRSVAPTTPPAHAHGDPSVPHKAVHSLGQVPVQAHIPRLAEEAAPRYSWESCRHVRHPYCPRWELTLAPQCALTSMAATFSTALPKQLSREITRQDWPGCSRLCLASRSSISGWACAQDVGPVATRFGSQPYHRRGVWLAVRARALLLASASECGITEYSSDNRHLSRQFP